MAEIHPFRGILYDTARIGDLSRVLAPPYDVIGPDERARLAALDAHNAVQLILPEAPTAGGDKYAHAGELLRSWIAGGFLRRDARPALYRYHQIFKSLGETYTRKGFICAIRLQNWDEGVILRHERTLAGPKRDRLQLGRATHCQLSQVFGLYHDPQHVTDAAFAALEAGAPELVGTTSLDGVEHRLWRLTDAAAIAEVTGFIADKKIYVADGHHRYETRLAFRDEMRPLAISRDASSEFGAIFLCNMDDPGLVVLPTHRVVHGLPSFDWERTLAAARRWFTVEEVTAPSSPVLRGELARRGRHAPTFALASGEHLAYLSLAANARLDDVAALAGPAVLRRLDVTLLHALVIEEILGIDRERQAAQTNLRYLKDLDAALAEARAPGAQLVALLNPTPPSDVQAVSDAGEVMPQKSTFFYPKIASGLVLNPVEPTEAI